MMGNFDVAARFVLQQEGGLSDQPSDRGGRTNWGITQKLLDQVRPGRKVDTLTMNEAREIFREVFWNAIQGDKLPAAIALVLLDMAVHSGPQPAIRMLQEACGAKNDGLLGPKTFDRVFARDPRYLATELCRRRGDFLIDLARRDTSQLVFLKGWLRRLLDLVTEVHRGDRG